MVKEVLQWYGAMIEKALDRAMPREECPQREVFEACRYSLLAGGKRIRPCLLLEFYRLCGGNPQDALAFACGRAGNLTLQRLSSAGAVLFYLFLLESQIS